MHGIKLYHFGTAYKIGLLGVGFIGRLSIYPLESAGLRRAKLDLFYIRPLCVHCTWLAHAPYCLQDLTCLSRMRDLPRLSGEHLPPVRGGWQVGATPGGWVWACRAQPCEFMYS